MRRSDFDDFDLLLAMDRSNLADLRALARGEDDLAKVRLLREFVVRIACKEIFEGLLRDCLLVQILAIDLADAEQSPKTVFAAGIFPAQEFVLPDGGLESRLIVTQACLFGEKFGYCEHT